MPKNLSLARSRAASRQSFRCYYCQLPVWSGDPQAFMRQFRLTPDEARRQQCTAEHLTARCDGGGNRAANIAAACLHCNRTRHLRARPLDPMAFRVMVQRRLSLGKWHPRSITAKLAAKPVALAGRVAHHG